MVCVVKSLRLGVVLLNRSGGPGSDSQQESVTRLEEWIQDRESKLHAAIQHRSVMITRRSTLGINTLSSAERCASTARALGETNIIWQDIQAIEPLVRFFDSLQVGLVRQVVATWC